MASDRERFIIKNSLISLLKCVEGMHTTVELRNENFVTGMFDEVDAFMNITMSDVVFKTYSGQEKYFSNFYVQGKNVRYVQIPDEINMKEALEFQVNITTVQQQKARDAVRDAAMKKSVKRSRENKKAEVRKERQKIREQEMDLKNKSKEHT